MAMRCHCTSSRMEHQTPTAPHTGEACGATGALTAAGNGNGAATLEDSVAFSYKMLHILTIHPATALKNRSTQKPAHQCSSFIPRC